MTLEPLTHDPYPSLPLAGWRATKDTLHLWLQIVGKIRLTLQPRLNHWWHVPLYVSPRGLTTREIAYGENTVTIEFDFVAHELVISESRGGRSSFALADGLSVAAFYRNVFAILEELGVDCELRKPVPYEHPTSKVPLAVDEEHRSYDREAVERYWRILTTIDRPFEEFRGRFVGKSSPVHLFWHSFDLALTRFSGRPAAIREGAGMVEAEAYSHEVISFGFWAGDDNIAAPSFYSYTAPLPDGLTDEPLASGAKWVENRGGILALLPYDEMRATPDPRQALLDFFESAYRAGAKRAKWDVDAFTPRPLKRA
jgi:hypothetical protein